MSIKKQNRINSIVDWYVENVYEVQMHNMMKRTGKLSERQGLTVETANRICRDVLQAEPIFKRESFGQFKGSVNTNK